MNGWIHHLSRLAALLMLLLLSVSTQAADQCVQPPSGIIAWWPFDETSGNTAQDQAGSHTGAYANNPVPSEGKVGGSLRFNGTNYVAVPDSDDWAFGTKDFTIELWANFDALGGGSIGEPGDIFIGNDEGPGYRNKWFFALGGGNLNFHINSPSIGPRFFPRAQFSPEVGQWYHLAVTKSGTTYTLFINGAPVAEAIDINPVPNANAPLTIGQSENIGFMNGRLDEITVYNRALTQEELKAIVDASYAGKCKNIQISPDSGGNTGKVTLSVSGGLFVNGATVKLARSGEQDIIGDPIIVQNDNRILNATFDLVGKALGRWDVIVQDPTGNPISIPNGFNIEEGRTPDLWANIVGLPVIRPENPQIYFIAYGNRSNVDAVGVPILVSYRKTAIRNLDIQLSTPKVDNDVPDWTTLPTTIESGDEVMMPLIAPRIPAGTTILKEIKLTSSGAVSNFSITVTTADPLFNETQGHLNSAHTLQGIALTDSALWNPDALACYKEAALAGLQTLPPVDCVLSFLKLLTSSQVHCEWVSDEQVACKQDLTSPIWAAWEALHNCAGELFPPATIIEIATNLGNGIFAWDSPACRAARSRATSTDFNAATISSYDPNNKVGPVGFGLSQYITLHNPVTYVVMFENIQTATAPAQEVVITDQLDKNKIDTSTLSFGPIVFGNKKITSPAGLSNFSVDLDLRPENNLIARINASLNPNSGLLTLRLRSIDPTTGNLPADPLAGFLPPNVTPPEGDGSVAFTAMPKPGLPTGTEIRNKASIVFDTNAPIETPEWLNTIDNSKPESSVIGLPPTQTEATFQVSWYGEDVGAGVKDYSIFVSEDDGAFTSWLTNTPETQAMFTGQSGHRYAFYSVARDWVGNEEEAPSDADTITEVTSIPTDTTPPTITITTNVGDTIGGSGWYNLTYSGNDGVLVKVSASDSAGVTNLTCNDGSNAVLNINSGSGSFVLSNGIHSIACTATDGMGNTGAATGSTGMPVLFQIDQTPPGLNLVVAPNPVLLNGNATASANAADSTSGIASSTCEQVASNNVGLHSVNCSATDGAGNSATANVSYNVIYGFSGFFEPVDNPPVLNNAKKAGQIVPLKWHLTDANGIPVTNLASVQVSVADLSCDLDTSPNGVGESATGASGLQNFGDGSYQFNWKTPTNYANSCKTMKLDIGEGVGMEHTALFQFRK